MIWPWSAKQGEASAAAGLRLTCLGCAGDRFVVVGYEVMLASGAAGVGLVPARTKLKCATQGCGETYSMRHDQPGAQLVRAVREDADAPAGEPESSAPKPAPVDEVKQRMLADIERVLSDGPDATTRFLQSNPAVRMTDGRT